MTKTLATVILGLSLRLGRHVIGVDALAVIGALLSG